MLDTRQIPNLEQSLPTLIDQVGQHKGKEMLKVAVVIVPVCPLPFLDVAVAVLGGLMEGVNLMASQLVPQGEECPRRYRMVQEGVLSHSVPFGNVRVGGFDLWRSCGTLAKMLSMWLALQEIL